MSGPGSVTFDEWNDRIVRDDEMSVLEVDARAAGRFREAFSRCPYRARIYAKTAPRRNERTQKTDIDDRIRSRPSSASINFP
jgi:hypothetical protein